MSGGYDNTNSGALFRNDNKQQPNHPDHRGQQTVQCPHCGEKSDFWLSAWIKTAGPQAKNPGSKFFSLALTPKDDQQQSNSSDSGGNKGYNEDIPF